jgi:hypothetical protein
MRDRSQRGRASGRGSQPVRPTRAGNATHRHAHRAHTLPSLPLACARSCALSRALRALCLAPSRLCVACRVPVRAQGVDPSPTNLVALGCVSLRGAPPADGPLVALRIEINVAVRGRTPRCARTHACMRAALARTHSATAPRRSRPRWVTGDERDATGAMRGLACGGADAVRTCLPLRCDRPHAHRRVPLPPSARPSALVSLCLCGAQAAQARVTVRTRKPAVSALLLREIVETIGKAA